MYVAVTKENKPNIPPAVSTGKEGDFLTELVLASYLKH